MEFVSKRSLVIGDVKSIPNLDFVRIFDQFFYVFKSSVCVIFVLDKWNRNASVLWIGCNELPGHAGHGNAFGIARVVRLGSVCDLFGAGEWLGLLVLSVLALASCAYR